MAKIAYNGFPPEFRDAVAAISRLRLRAGDRRDRFERPAPGTPCAGCTATDGVAWHGEDYHDPVWSRYPVCKKCHYNLHNRLREPGRWFGYLNRVEKATGIPATWLRSLSVEAIDLYDPSKGPEWGHLVTGWNPAKVPAPWGDADWRTWQARRPAAPGSGTTTTGGGPDYVGFARARKVTGLVAALAAEGLDGATLDKPARNALARRHGINVPSDTTWAQVLDATA